jgi:hypothetical protein
MCAVVCGGVRGCNGDGKGCGGHIVRQGAAYGTSRSRSLKLLRSFWGLRFHCVPACHSFVCSGMPQGARFCPFPPCCARVSADGQGGGRDAAEQSMHGPAQVSRDHSPLARFLAARSFRTCIVGLATSFGRERPAVRVTAPPHTHRHTRTFSCPTHQPTHRCTHPPTALSRSRPHGRSRCPVDHGTGCCGGNTT